ncbi:MAG: cyclic nucleotide-binding domain-containing protein [Terracidiphilus sp.]|nr:cyclic nucleotide-binding domain-containing protein [Terracidiphilus sp.]MDR3798040.1 cyclic nucleotide-binding domain-containing protein [Terracidiphilus sp.]
MKSSIYQERSHVQLDPAAFLADPELIRALSEHATPIVCDTDRILFQQDDPAVGLYILHEGEATLSMTSQDGRTILSVQARDGSILGLPGLISNQPYSLTAVARAGAQVSFLGRSEFTTLMESNPPLAFKILQVLAAEVRSARNALY